MFKDKVPQDLLDEEPMTMAMYQKAIAQQRRSYYFQIPRSDGSAMRLLIRPRDRNYADNRVPKVVSPKGTNASEPSGKRPGLLWFHGGAFYMGAPETIFSTLANQLGDRYVTVAPDYRLGPYPNGLNDCVDTLKWMVANADSLGIDPDKIIVGGESAGGTLAVALCLFCRDNNGPKIAMQIPLYPMLDCRMRTPSSKEEDVVFWSASSNKEAWKEYLSEIEKGQPIPTYASPSLELNYHDLPPCITMVGTADIFHDEVKQYVEDLKAAGVSVRFKEFTGGYHMFDVIAPGAKLSQEARKFFNTAFNAYAKKYLDE